MTTAVSPAQYRYLGRHEELLRGLEQGGGGGTGGTGYTGATGAKGATGATGPQGGTGGPGAAGTTGPTGVAGSTGPTGPTGAAGFSGSNGPTGPTGIAGLTGPTGPSAGSDSLALHTANALSELQATGTTGPSNALVNLNVGVTRTISTATDTLTAADNGKTIVVSYAGAVTVTVPAGLPSGFGVTFDLENVLSSLIFTASGTTINDSRGPNMVAPCCQILLQTTGANVYRIYASASQVPWATTYDAGSTTTPAKTIDFNNGTDQVLALTQNCTITLTNVPALNRGSLRVTQAAGANFTITWAAATGSIRGPNGTRPQPTSAAGSATPITDLFVVNYDATGSKHYDIALAMPNLS